MQTNFTENQLRDPAMVSSESAIRKCVHCGFCTATCPTYVLLGDELDSPRGRIYLMKDMLEQQRRPTPEVVKHVDRCLSCLACMTTCPSDVNYMHLVDHARTYIAENYTRPWADRALRGVLAAILPYPARFRFAARFAPFAMPLRGLFGRVNALKPLAAMLTIAPRKLSKTVLPRDSRVGAGAGRVALLQGCVEPVLKPEYRAAAVRLLNRTGYDVLFANGEGCCGALVHHMGRAMASHAAARRNIDAWWPMISGEGLDAIIITASGCGSTIKNYGFMLRDDPDYAHKAARVSELATDISQFLINAGLPPGNGRNLTVAYHAACSLQHGQRVTEAPRQFLKSAGYIVRAPNEAHLCCGSAGTYNILQPEIAGQLGDRKAANIADLNPDVVATGNIGCSIHLGQRMGVPVVHIIELLDWATGGPAPAAVSDIQF
ncbi:MAG: glycolate oxidase subunit GlcF [Azonexus sp.]|jgi:glycolate oxidase iron-sulfur subunit|nr:glycolate oxidase subunit GlcF [Azonexus sp.]